MSTKTKKFDCVEMKNRIQAERYAEYLAHKDQFASYLDFINARVKGPEFAKRAPGQPSRQETGSDA
jgi:hypothetical protein